MEKNNMILSDQTVGKEYQIPELVELNSIGEAIGWCSPGSNPLPAQQCFNGSTDTM